MRIASFAFFYSINLIFSFRLSWTVCSFNNGGFLYDFSDYDDGSLLLYSSYRQASYYYYRLFLSLSRLLSRSLSNSFYLLSLMRLIFFVIALCIFIGNLGNLNPPWSSRSSSNNLIAYYPIVSIVRSLLSLKEPCIHP